MNKIFIKYGLIASAIVVGVPVLSGIFMGYGIDSFAMGEIIGYSSMIVAMAMVFFAMRHFRDNENEGQMSFGEGMKIGLAVSAIGGISFAIYNWIFVTWVMPDFNEQYYAYVSGNDIGTPQFEQGFSEMMETNGFLYSKLGGSLVMFITVFMIGLVISVISSFILQKRNVSPAA